MSLASDPVYATTSARIAQDSFGSSALSGAAATSTSPAIDPDLRALQQIGVKVRFSRNETIFSDGDETTNC